MANLILASKREVKSGAMMWHVYRSEDSVKSGEFYFSEPLKALSMRSSLESALAQ